MQPGRVGAQPGLHRARAKRVRVRRRGRALVLHPPLLGTFTSAQGSTLSIVITGEAYGHPMKTVHAVQPDLCGPQDVLSKNPLHRLRELRAEPQNT